MNYRHTGTPKGPRTLLAVLSLGTMTTSLEHPVTHRGLTRSATAIAPLKRNIGGQGPQCGKCLIRSLITLYYFGPKHTDAHCIKMIKGRIRYNHITQSKVQTLTQYIGSFTAIVDCA